MSMVEHAVMTTRLPEIHFAPTPSLALPRPRLPLMLRRFAGLGSGLYPILGSLAAAAILLGLIPIVG